ncbi:NADPH dehydrogenase NamA [Rubeoparvulum massiliense]|uniref:NADPH dehydrogenase NamA n=1 Tax=Rubeoparvulum massiliense TaxID=1631346 RepID=UPI00065DCA4F|nr:NADPH dehydrogenase NamA [Rubeoparvulum massiliense]
MSLLLSPYHVKDLQLKNRIVMSPMCMYACEEKDGKVTPWHLTHYGSRAIGQVGLIIQEATAVLPAGRISEEDLGIWEDEQVAGLTQLVQTIHAFGSKAGIQLAHAGRKALVPGTIFAPSAIPYNEQMRVPKAMTQEEIDGTIEAFGMAARRARLAGYDLIEIHGAHGYLINEFLSPLTNHRQDQYGGNIENRYRFLHQVIEAVKEEWDGPLFVRISGHEYHPDGQGMTESIQLAQWMKEDGVDLIDVSSGGVVSYKIHAYPGYQVPFAEGIKREAGIPTGAVGLITQGIQGEEILQNQRADLIFIGRELLRDPYWPRTAALQLHEEISVPKPYERGW